MTDRNADSAQASLAPDPAYLRMVARLQALDEVAFAEFDPASKPVVRPLHVRVVTGTLSGATLSPHDNSTS